MKNRWSDDDAASCIADHQADGVNEDVALRVYTSRLIGVEPALVIHGGGNTSVKTRMADFLEREQSVICVKGSGWDLATIEAPGLPALLLEPLHEVRNWQSLTDEDMVKFQRLNLLDPASPNPSVETLLHAFLPHKFVDHSHASAILALSDQKDGPEICARVFGDRVAITPYVMAGFQLAKKTADTFDAHPEVEGIILEKHGLFTFGHTAKQSYARMIELVSLAEDAINAAPAWAPAQIARGDFAAPSEIIPIIRGACAGMRDDGAHKRLIADFRRSDQIMQFVNGADLADYGARGVVTPDHIIRTKNHYLVTTAPVRGDMDTFTAGVAQAISHYRADYDAYFNENNARLGGVKTKLDSTPRVALMPGVGLIGMGASAKDAAIAADLAEITIDTVIKAERVGAFEPLSPAELFDMEYWSLEQAKLGKAKPKPLAGQIAIITGGAGAIGFATARLLAENGAEVALLDIDGAAAMRVAEKISPYALGLHCDLTEDASVKTAFDAVVTRFGGIDILVSNAGAAWESMIADMDDDLLRKSFEINFFAHQRAAQAAVAVMKKQRTDGALLFNVSKQAVNPGENFGAYGLPKASTLFLMRQYALECGKFGIRANAVNADRIRSGILTDEMIAKRAKARGLSEADYTRANLLRREVTADDVAQAFLHHATALKTTGDVTTVDGGNVAAMLR
ncbi:MAG: bifunctional aldolase/short-chain dehydrogenase [Parvularculaceae bacterium]